jgi:general secretion pathway protein A
MYKRHFKLAAEPFSLTPDPAFLYASRGHAEALAALKIGLQGRRGLMVMTGEVGTGKTTLLYSLLNELGDGVRTAYISNTMLSLDQMLRQALADFQVPCDTRDKLELLTALNTFLVQCATEGTTAALVIDEAQNLEEPVFENIRLLSNFETFTTKLLQIVLVGQPELDAKLRRSGLRQVAERIAVRCHINPLSRAESRKYIAHRLRCAGGSLDLFTEPALRLVVGKSQGIPRRINILCHNALLFTYGRGAQRVGRSMVRAAVREREGRGLVTLRSRSPGTSAAPAPPRRWLRPALGIASAAVAVGVVAGMSFSDPGLWHRSQLAEPVSPPHDVPAALTKHELPPLAVDSTPSRLMEDAANDLRPARGERERAMNSGEGSALLSVSGDGLVKASGGVLQRPAIAAAAPPADSTGKGEVAAAAPAEAAAPASTVAVAADSPAPQAAETALSAAAEGPARIVRVAPGATLTSLVQDVYGSVTPSLLSQVQMANPQISDLNYILAGDTLRFPEIDAGRSQEGTAHE